MNNDLMEAKHNNTIKLENSKGIKKIITLLTMFMFLTILMYILSPIEWPTYKPLRLYFFVFTYILAFFIGGSSAHRKMYNLENYHNKGFVIAKIKILRYLRISIPITLAFTLVYTAYNLSMVGTSGNLYTQIYSAIFNMSIGYYEKGQNTAPKILNYITVLGGPLFVSTNIFGFLFYKELKRKQKILFVIYAIVEVVRWLIIGTGKGAIAIAINFAISLLIRKYILVNRDNGINNKEYQTKKQKKVTWIKIFLVVFLALLVFGFVGIGRAGNDLSQQFEGRVNSNHFIYKVMPIEVAFVILRIFSYLCQGYYGLSLTGHLDWVWTYGFGNSGFIRQRLTNIIGYDVIWPKTYQHRLDAYGWHETSNWHTMYVWFANDISLVGVIFLMFLFGRILAKSLYDGFYRGNINAMIVAFLTVNVILYSSMNNQVFANADTFMSFIVFYSLWSFSRFTNRRFK